MESGTDTGGSYPNIVETVSALPDNENSDMKDNKYMDSSRPPLTLVWNKLTYDVAVPAEKFGLFKKDQKRVLDGIYGSLKPGEFMAVMGTSGAGKTTCLNVIASRHLDGGTIGGHIIVNGKKRDSSFRKLSAYVEQDDLLMPFLTVRETFYFAAELRMSKRFSVKEKQTKAVQVITKLGILSAIDTRIGDAMNRGVSGGERKRVAIGSELLLNPRILFLDEPTSGLDSFTSFHVMKTVKSLILESGMATMVTIHQPRADLFALFDKLLLLSKGQVAFYGPVNRVLSIFETAGYPCHISQNPADHILDITTFDRRTPELEAKSVERIDRVIQAYKQSDMFTAGQNEINELMEIAALDNEHDHNTNKKNTNATKWKLNHIQQFNILMRRNVMNFTRDFSGAFAGLMQSIIMALVCGFSFWHVGLDGPKSIQNRTGAIFFITLNNGMSPVFASLHLFHKEKALFTRERAAGTYRVSPYFAAKALAEFPIQALGPILFVVIAYFLVGFASNASHVFLMILTLVVLLFTAQSWGMFLSAITPNLEVAQAFAPIITIMFMLFSGFYFNKESMSPALVWIYYVSYITYALNSMMMIEYKGLEFNCEPTDINCYKTGDDVIAYYGIENSFWYNLGMLALVGVVVRLLGFAAFYYLSKPKMAKEKND